MKKVAAHHVVRVIYLQGSMLLHVHSAKRTTPWPVWLILKLSHRRTQYSLSTVVHSVVLVVQHIDHPTTLQRPAWARRREAHRSFLQLGLT
jgi:hypothetical protein